MWPWSVSQREVMVVQRKHRSLAPQNRARADGRRTRKDREPNGTKLVLKWMGRKVDVQTETILKKLPTRGFPRLSLPYPCHKVHKCPLDGETAGDSAEKTEIERLACSHVNAFNFSESNICTWRWSTLKSVLHILD